MVYFVNVGSTTLQLGTDDLLFVVSNGLGDVQMCSVWQCHSSGTGVCYSAMDMVEGNLTAFPGCPASDALEGVASPSPGRTVISSGSYETRLT